KEIGGRLNKISREVYDMRDLHGGLHELRRDLRWNAVFSEGLSGFVQFDGAHHPIPELASLAGNKEAEKEFKFVKPDAPDREEGPVNVSQSAFMGLLKTVEELGNLKDKLEELDTFEQAHAAAKLPFADSAVKREDAFKEAETIYGDLQRMKLVDAIAEAFKKPNT
ncbi:MAG: hypothetical protein ACT4TC_04355, partial [Myxococcaceae bacterium]